MRGRKMENGVSLNVFVRKDLFRLNGFLDALDLSTARRDDAGHHMLVLCRISRRERLTFDKKPQGRISIGKSSREFATQDFVFPSRFLDLYFLGHIPEPCRFLDLYELGHIQKPQVA